MILLLGCASHTPLTASHAPPVPHYERVVEEWTREARKYDGLETLLLVRATWDSPELVESREMQRAFYLVRSPEVVENELASVRADAMEQWHFTLAGSSDKKVRPEFSGDSGPWRVRLVVGEAECSVVSVEERVPSEMDRGLYPWITHWNNLWDVVFDRDCGRPMDGGAILQVTGPGAAVELRWE